ncbi:hypothetical protein TRAPUB_6107 [Trametes pubescens]|uniref:Uncharacterized protein n=1 Tax=Trametes pubescens TaxID=154538 RepID=A0A1M2V6U5_TRAPU|nr:hypothetical protein TRAPUB_6107 [Trametes pubescens]
MPFPFSFSLAAPGITNPFAVTEQPAPPFHYDTDVQHTSVPHRRPPSPSLLPPRSRKRGWVPSSAEPSRPTSYHTSTSGYLDTPAKYRDMASESAEQDEVEDMVADLPPPKRRRTLAGSIVSTALSAALIGTAVGLTVYRLWRDRGKHPEILPPPYEQGGWVPPQSEQAPAPETPKVVVTAPTTPRSKKSRHVAGRRTVPRHRKTPSRVQTSHYATSSSSYASRAPIPAEFSFASGSRSSPPQPDEEPDVDDQMSWIGDKLAHLIAEGQKALGKEIVIMSEDKEDEVDDGSGAWVEEDEPLQGSSRSPGLPPYSPTPSSRSFARGVSVDSDSRSVRSAFAEDDSAWASPEMRESMERARMRYRQKRGL